MLFIFLLYLFFTKTTRVKLASKDLSSDFLKHNLPIGIVTNSKEFPDSFILIIKNPEVKERLGKDTFALEKTVHGYKISNMSECITVDPENIQLDHCYNDDDFRSLTQRFRLENVETMPFNITEEATKIKKEYDTDLPFPSSGLKFIPDNEPSIPMGIKSIKRTHSKSKTDLKRHFKQTKNGIQINSKDPEIEGPLRDFIAD
ncbi:putative SP-containing protein [Vairimorpha necatrix]|uniref:SP-containing protein n=1 Tax=Vairimorpha necatrix TaxID=6039 RepID=A0AAX4JEP4_9MICR